MPEKTAPQGVPYLSLQQEFHDLREEWFSRIESIGSGGAFILGPNVRAFEQEAAEYVGSDYAVAVANGTDALVLSLRAMDIGSGDEVITTPFTFFATAEAISIVGATPVFADIDEASFNLDPDSVAARINDRTKAILPVHIFGNPADMIALNQLAQQHGLAVIEDAAQAFGARCGEATVGGLGSSGCFSFYPTKVLGCYGDGGLITTSDERVRDRLLKLRNHGATAPFTHDELGYNSRLDEVQAALLRIKLTKLEQDIAARIQVADWYDARLAQLDLVTPVRPDLGRHAFNLYTIRHPRRDLLRAHLSAHNIGNSQCYPLGLHLQDIYKDLGYQEGDLPVVDRVCGETLSLPIFPAMTEEQVDSVCDLIAEI
ncbi:DegT/DnrJ/EryC1/StrS family aminotransferase [Sedimenticola sp.]|uniref:DegT/DnrJ/EryC1/StrS family aminotransferase n=1 Tax=Sedimenticola sp. TaxID=1940285 RepID=UPI003D147FA5